MTKQAIKTVSDERSVADSRSTLDSRSASDYINAEVIGGKRDRGCLAWSDEIPQKMIRFFSVEPYEEIVEESTDKYGNVRTKISKRVNKLPTFSDFAKYIGVSSATLSNWRETRPEFDACYVECKELQKNFLIQNGLVDNYNATFAIFVAKNITDMKDKTEVENTINLPKVPDAISSDEDLKNFLIWKNKHEADTKNAKNT